jgi:hypothetical protein
MPEFYAVQITGHTESKEKESAIWSYYSHSRALTIPGALILAGFEPYPYGRNGNGPMPPSLDALHVLGVDMTVLEAMIDDVFCTARAPLKFKIDQEARPMMHIAFATVVMYHDERVTAGEMAGVQDNLRETFMGFLNIDRGSANETMTLWGSHIQAKFVSDNLPLTESPVSTAQVRNRLWFQTHYVWIQTDTVFRGTAYRICVHLGLPQM